MPTLYTDNPMDDPSETAPTIVVDAGVDSGAWDLAGAAPFVELAGVGATGGTAPYTWLWEVVEVPVLYPGGPDATGSAFDDDTALDAALLPEIPGEYGVRLRATDANGYVGYSDVLTIDCDIPIVAGALLEVLYRTRPENYVLTGSLVESLADEGPGGFHLTKDSDGTRPTLVQNILGHRLIDITNSSSWLRNTAISKAAGVARWRWSLSTHFANGSTGVSGLTTKDGSGNRTAISRKAGGAYHPTSVDDPNTPIDVAITTPALTNDDGGVRVFKEVRDGVATNHYIQGVQSDPDFAGAALDGGIEEVGFYSNEGVSHGGCIHGLIIRDCPAALEAWIDYWLEAERTPFDT